MQRRTCSSYSWHRHRQTLAQESRHHSLSANDFWHIAERFDIAQTTPCFTIACIVLGIITFISVEASCFVTIDSERTRAMTIKSGTAAVFTMSSSCFALKLHSERSLVSIQSMMSQLQEAPR